MRWWITSVIIAAGPDTTSQTRRWLTRWRIDTESDQTKQRPGPNGPGRSGCSAISWAATLLTRTYRGQARGRLVRAIAADEHTDPAGRRVRFSRDTEGQPVRSPAETRPARPDGPPRRHHSPRHPRLSRHRRPHRNRLRARQRL